MGIFQHESAGSTVSGPVAAVGLFVQEGQH